MDPQFFVETVKGFNQITDALGEIFTPGRVLMLGYIYCCIVQGLVPPVKKDSKLYKTFYTTAHVVAGNILLAKKEFKVKNPKGNN
jgi:hypothetical protein